jgi:hypothetical protein
MACRSAVWGCDAAGRFDPLKERIVLQQLIELSQDGIHHQAQGGHQRKQIHWIIAVAQYRALSFQAITLSPKCSITANQWELRTKNSY